MPLVTTKEMFKKAYEGGYAIGAFNVNNMEIIQGITEAAKEVNAPLILQVSAGARKYANHTYLVKLVEAAIEETGLPIALHLDHGDSFELCKSCIDGGFTSVMIDGSHLDYEENVALTKKVVDYAHERGVVVEGELGRLAGIEDAVNVSDADASYTDPDQVYDFVTRTGVDSLAIAIGTSHGAYKFKPGQKPQLAVRYFKGSGKAAAELPNRPARRKQRYPGICKDDQRKRRLHARRNRHSGGDAPRGRKDGGLQNQHRFRPAPGYDGDHPEVFPRQPEPLRPQAVFKACTRGNPRFG